MIRNGLEFASGGGNWITGVDGFSVGRAGVGLDNVEIPAATERGVMVVNAPTSNIHSAAEHAVALLMSTARQIPAADKTLRENTWKRSKFNGVEILGKTVRPSKVIVAK